MSKRSPRAAAARRLRPAVEALEGREVPANLIGLTSNNALVRFDSAAPATVISTTAITGLQTNENLVGIDYRPSNGLLYGVGSSSRVYTIDPASGAATAVAAPFTPALDGTAFGVDFNPVADKLRVVSNTGQNLRVNVATGAVAATDTPLTYNADSYNSFFTTASVPAPQVVAAAYTSKTADPTSATGAFVTTLYGIDANLDTLVIQGNPDGTANPDAPVADPTPNGGVLTIVNALGFDANADTSFDIQNGSDAAFAVSAGKLYTIDLTAGVGTAVGLVGTGISLNGLTVGPAAAGAGTLGFTAAAAAFPAGNGPLAVTVTRTGGATGAVSAAFATADGTAVNGTDYLGTSGTVSFADGQTTQTIFLTRPSGAPPATAKTFTLTLSTPTGATLGATAAVTVTVPAGTAAATGRTFAVGAGAGGSPVVNVYDAKTGASLYTLTVAEATFTGGVTVASGDVDGDGIDDTIVGFGAGGGPRVTVYSGATKAAIANFFAYESTFRGGVNVAAGDVNGDGQADIIIGTGVGGGPRVRVIDGATVTDATQTQVFDFFAYEDTFRGGVNVASGEFTGDQNADIVAGAGFGGGPRIKIIDGKTQATVNDYFAYEDTFRNGVFVAAGDVNGDHLVDAIAGSGPGGGPAVRAFSGTTSTSIQSFFAYDQNSRGGVRVAAADRNGDNTDDIITGAGPGLAPTVKTFTAGVETASFDAFATAFTGGVFVG